MVKTEFGKGLTYCLGLFLCHSERNEMFTEDMAKKLDMDEETRCGRNSEMWFYGASDHLYEMQIPDFLPNKLKNRLKIFQNKCMGWRLPMDKSKNATQEDKDWAVNEAKKLLRLIDKHHGVSVAEAQWS